jgi:hypothetical protein
VVKRRVRGGFVSSATLGEEIVSEGSSCRDEPVEAGACLQGAAHDVQRAERRVERPAEGDEAVQEAARDDSEAPGADRQRVGTVGRPSA